MKLCTIAGCERKHQSRGMCHTHYELNRRTGSPYVQNPTADNSGPCSFNGCDKPAKCQTLCDKHYTRLRRHGRPSVTKSNRDLPPMDRFWRKVDLSNITGCWLWIGAAGVPPKDHGIFVPVNGGPHRVAHRWFWEQVRGPVLPPHEDLDHLCRTPRCVNPAHLEPVTHRENCLRGTSPSANNARKTHCKHGHLFDEANTYYSVTGGRHCRACARKYQAGLRARRSQTQQASDRLPRIASSSQDESDQESAA